MHTVRAYRLAMSYLTKMEKLWFPGFVLLFQVVALVLFGTLVEYDDRGAPLMEADLNASGGVHTLASSRTTRQVYPFFQDVHVMIFIGFGFLMTFLQRYSYSSVGFNLLLAAFAIQWSTITSGLFTFIEQDGMKIRVSLESLVGSDFAAAAVLITMGAVLGRASPFQLVVIAFFELMFYSANEALNIHVLEAADIGGSMIIHTFGAYFGLAVSFLLYRKKANDQLRNSSVYHSDIFAMIGTLFLWLYWPSFNSVLASGNAQTRAIINTYYSMTGSVVSTFIFSMVFDSNRKLNMTHVQNATLAGGVAVGAVADMLLQPWGAILIGCSAGLISVIGYRFLSPTMAKWFYLQDTCGVHNLHGLPGVLGGVASAIAAGAAEFEGGRKKIAYGNSLYIVFPARAPEFETELTMEQQLLGIEPGEGRHAGSQAGFQLALLFSSIFIAIFGGLITGAILHLPLFHKTPANYFFDDIPYWQLPDDAKDYFRPSKGSEADATVAETYVQSGIPLKELSKEFVLKNEQAEEMEEPSTDTSTQEEEVQEFVLKNVLAEEMEREAEGDEEPPTPYQEVEV